jgi:hypothetical protein
MNETSKGVNWCGELIRPGDFGYGGRPEAIEGTKKDRREVITEADVAAIFKDGALTKAEAAQQLESNTKAHRASCYRALALDGRFATHLRVEGERLTWK